MTGRLFSGLQEGYSIFIKTLAYTRLICDNLDMQEETTSAIWQSYDKLVSIILPKGKIL
jgi:hypothetical protein